MQTRAIFFTGVDAVSFGMTEIPEPEAGEVMIEAAVTCVSPGTELRALAGMQAGTPGWPFIPGYALAGRILREGPETTLPPGTRVLTAGTLRASSHRLWGGHVGHAVQAEAAVFPIPDSVSLEEAAVTRLAAIAYHGVRLSRPQAHESVAMIGLGAIGQLAARVHALHGARVVAADLAPGRVAIARAAGIEAFVPREGLEAGFRRRLPEGADIVVECTGVAALLQEAVAIARDQPYGDVRVPGARLLIQATYAGEMTLPYMPVFKKELSILVPRDRQPRDMRAALDLVARRKLPVRDLVSVVRPPEDAPEVYAALRERSGEMITAAFHWSDLE